MTTNEQVKRAAEEIAGFLFDDYPDNEMNRGQATEHIAAIISKHLSAIVPKQWTITMRVSQLNADLAKIQQYKAEHPDEKLGYYTNSVGSILNAYREGDLTFDEAVALLRPKTSLPAPEQSPRVEPEGFRNRVFNRNDLILEDYYYLDWLLKCEFPASVHDNEEILPCGHPICMHTKEGIHHCGKYVDGLKVAGSAPDGGVEAMRLPWFREALKDWSIVGMNHYVLDTSVYYDIQTRFLYVAMTKGNQCIKAQGANQLTVWDDLERQAMELESLTPARQVEE